MEYKVGGENRANHFLDFELSVPCKGLKTIKLILPKWRPGRYEMGNFAKNIRGFQITNERGKTVDFKKTESHTWEVLAENSAQLLVKYQVYANELNAGSSYTDLEQLYVNPINCCFYTEELKDLPHRIRFEVPQDYIFATSLKQVKKSLFEAKNFDELADSPVIASKNLKHGSFNVGRNTFHLWFQGECKPNWKKLTADFTAFIKRQVADFGSTPFKDFHFLFQITPYPYYHGVEHLNSTVIALGPGFQLMDEVLYKELLGVSSHELFHAWNVKSIRPKEMLPYDYQHENYTELGYITEGFTTYFGDLYLSKAELADEKMWFDLLHKLLDRHSLNYGRYNYSVKESSFDTWLDGYVKGIPNRKTSIYVEGALIAWMLDLEIIHGTKGKENLSSLMQALYIDFALKGQGVAESTLIDLLKKLTGKDFNDFFQSYYSKSGDLFEGLNQRLKYIGLGLEKIPHEHYAAKKWGLLIDSQDTVSQMAPDSPGEKNAFGVGDQIISINGISVKRNANAWFNYFEEEIDVVVVESMGQLKTLTLTPASESYFEKYRLKKTAKSNALQKALFDKWCK